MAKHIFTAEERQRGGWTKCRLDAQRRRNTPSEHEQAVIDELHQLGRNGYEREWEFWNELAGFPQFLDFYWPEKNLALEADGSNDYHSVKYASKMVRYDTAKSEWCKAHGITLITIGKNNVGNLAYYLEGKTPPPEQVIDF